MKKYSTLILCLFLYINNIFSQIQGLSNLIKKIDPCVFKIYTVNSENEYETQGSGVFISNNGICISNFHVLTGAKKAIIITSDGKKFNISKIFDYSKSYDLIKFKIDNGTIITPFVNMNNSLPLKGSDVFAVGYPNGFNINGESTLSTGIVSGIRDLNGEKIIQTSAPFTHGSSGGGLFDTSGKLIGITSGTFAQEIKDRHANINKVIPVASIIKLNRNLNINLIDLYEKTKNTEFNIQGLIAYEKFDFEIAIPFFEKHLKEYPEDAVTWFRLGNSYNQIGRGSQNEELLNNAIQCFDISISLDTNYYHPWGQAALVNSILGNIDDAKFYAINAYKIEPNVSFTNYVLGKVANEARDFEIAIEFLSYAIEKASEIDKKQKTHQWYLERAISYNMKKDDYNAEKDFQKCLALNPNNFDGIFQYGIFLFNRNRKKEACEKFLTLYRLYPNYKAGDQILKDIIEKNCN